VLRFKLMDGEQVCRNDVSVKVTCPLEQWP